MFDWFVENTQIFLLVFARVFALVSITPLLSSSNVPSIARVTLALFTSFAIAPGLEQAYVIPEYGLAYAALLLGEVLIGLIIGFFLQLIYAAFTVAGQFFSLHMGFGASEVFDPLAQIEIPALGQFLNSIAMFVFVFVSGFYRTFYVGVSGSFRSVTAYALLTRREDIVRLFISGFADMFEQALIISFPILGLLFIISVSMGLLAKAAPQMNLLMMGFPVAIIAGFIMFFMAVPFLMQAFGKIIDYSFYAVSEWFSSFGGAS